MGIADAIARAARLTKSAREGGLPAAMVELGQQLRSDGIPAPLRPAASRLAALLSVEVARGSKPVSLSQAALGHSDVAAHSAHGMAAGVCPFTGQRADGSIDPAFQAAAGFSAGAAVPAPGNLDGSHSASAQRGAGDANGKERS